MCSSDLVFLFGRSDVQRRIVRHEPFTQQKAKKTFNGGQFSSNRTFFMLAIEQGKKRLNAMMINCLYLDGTLFRSTRRLFHEGEELPQIAQVVS